MLLLGFGIAAGAQTVEVFTYEQFEARVANQKQEIVIYNFWATWCKPCVEEMPAFEKLSADYKAKGVHVVFVSLDFKSKHEKVVAFAKQKKLQSEVILLNAPDYNAWIDKVSTEWGGSIPATLVVKKTGSIRKFHEGSFTYNELVNFIKPLIK
ncbi:redoxin domain-containing protein [soil metagenome]